MKSSVLRLSTMTLSLAMALQFPLAGAAEQKADSAKRQTKTISAGASKQATSPNPQQQQASAGQKLFSQAELDQMLAPVALYPDTVLSHVLIAATYPLEIVKATRWLSAQKGMTSEQALKAAENEPWDPSVRALVAFAPLLTKMNNELEWTQKLGDAFLIQQQQVMATVQALREKAYAAGNLKDQEHITVQRREKEKVIIIEPRQREVVYVPVYDTRVVYGDWWWRDYPPIHWPHPVYGNHASLVYWGSGARVSTSFYFSTFYWPRREVVVINHYHRPTHYYRYDDIIRHEERRHWRHNPHHRHGVVYHTSYQPNREFSGADYRQDDVGERRRWAAEQRQQQNVALPGDQDIQRQYPVSTQEQVMGSDPARDVERLQRNRDIMRDNDSNALVIEHQNDVMLPEQTQTEPTVESRTEDRLHPALTVSGDKNEYSLKDAGLEQEIRPQPVPDITDNTNSGMPADQQLPTTEVPAELERTHNRDMFRPVEPVVEQPRPIEQQPEPVYQQPEPVYQQPEPVYQQPEPVYQ
ncbi:DUF3300 domain-containing protein, partial [Rheinheimera sp.]|uniref:DUF3300 domain-containing protein n=1 Tax=Rheinheimera sp. TaxID=1869214 RepID=UPI002FDE1C46